MPSASVNPANQLGSRIPVTSTTGLGTGVILGKAFFKLSDKPKLSEAFMATIRFKSLIVRPFFCPNIKICTICLNNSKSALFWVNKGYLSKCGIITLIISLIDRT